MKKSVLTGLLIGCILLFTACAAARGTGQEAAETGTDSKALSSSGEGDRESEGESESAYHKITAEEAKKMMDEGNVTVVDVRRQDEYEASHIPGAILVPNESIGDEALEALPDKDAVLLVHCRTGIRSKQASDKLAALGYTNIYDFGGIVDWPYDTESGE